MDRRPTLRVHTTLPSVEKNSACNRTWIAAPTHACAEGARAETHRAEAEAELSWRRSRSGPFGETTALAPYRASRSAVADRSMRSEVPPAQPSRQRAQYLIATTRASIAITSTSTKSIVRDGSFTGTCTATREKTRHGVSHVGTATTHASRPAPANIREFPVPEAARAARHQSAKIEFADQSEPEKGNS